MPFIAPAIAAIAEIGAVVGAAWGAIGIVGQGLIMAGVGIASSYLISALTPKPKTTADTIGGVQFQRQYGSDVSRQVACGLVGIAGHDTYINTFNPSNQDVIQIFTLSDYYATALTRIAIDGVYETLGADDPGGRGRPVVTGKYAGSLIFVKFIDGRQTAVDPVAFSTSNPVGRWTASAVGHGVAAVQIYMTYDKDKLTSFPDFFFEFQGAPLYDFRKDTTVGGSGSHRWGDVTTHEFTKNPIIMAYNYRRGLSVNGDLFCGMGMPSTDLPLDKWTIAANICDEAYGDGRARYECSIMLDCMAMHSENLQSVALSCGAMEVDNIDGSFPIVGSAQPSVDTFTDDDIISVADFKYVARRSMSELVNGVSGNFPDPEQLWSLISYDPQISSGYVTVDRRTRDVDINFPQVSWHRQACQLASIFLYENRYEITATVTLRPRFQGLEAGDWVDWNSARYGLKTFMVTGKSLLSLNSDSPRNVVLTLQQRDGSIYSGVAPPVVVLPLPNDAPIYSEEVDSFVALPVIVSGANGRAMPGIRVSWAAVTDVTVTHVEVIYYPTAQPTAILSRLLPVERTVVVLTDVVANTQYTVQSKILTLPERVTVYNAGATVTTPNVMITMVDVGPEIQYNISALQDLFADKLSNIEQQIAGLAANQDARGFNDKQQIRSQLMATSGAALAAVTTLQQTVASDESAFATYQTSVTAQFGTVNANVTTNSSAIATLNGYAAAQYSVTLDVNGYAIGFNLLNGGSGISAATFVVDKFQIAKPGVTGGAAVPIFTLGTVAGISKIGIRADMYIDGTITGQMVAANTISAANIVAGSITSASGVIGALSVKSLSIADNAATVPVGQTWTNTVAVLTTQTDTNGFTLSVDTTGLTGKTLSFIYNLQWNQTISAADSITARVLINGTVDGFAVSSGPFNTVLGIHSWTASGGTDSFVIGTTAQATSSGTCTVSNRTLWAMAAKR